MKPHFYLVPRKIENAYLVRHHILPNLGTLWHYHPELEIHYIIRGKGVRFVGDNISNFDTGELLFLGENLPHMWQCTEEYFRKDESIKAEAIVVQFLPDFMGKDLLQKSEFGAINDLYEKARKGFVVHGADKQKIIDLMRKAVQAKGIQNYILILSMLEILVNSKDLEPIASRPTHYQSDQAEADRLNRVMSFTMKNFKEELSLSQIATVANLSVTSFCRYFKMMTKKTFLDFLIEIRISHAKRLLDEEPDITTEAVCYECGFNNRSNFFQHFKKITGYTPDEYRRASQTKTNFL